MAFSPACSDDPESERRGGPLPTPVDDPSAAGAQGAGGAGAPGAAGSPSGAPIAWCSTLVVLQSKCQRCHQDPPKNGAPMSLLTYDDTQAMWTTTLDVHDVMLDAVERDFMPYVALNEPPTSIMPPVEPLTPDEKATLLGWLEQGALPEGGTECP